MCEQTTNASLAMIHDKYYNGLVYAFMANTNIDVWFGLRADAGAASQKKRVWRYTDDSRPTYFKWNSGDTYIYELFWNINSHGGQSPQGGDGTFKWS